MNRQRTAVTMAAIMAFSAAAPMTAEASSSYSMRKKVITAAGIMTALKITFPFSPMWTETVNMHLT